MGCSSEPGMKFGRNSTTEESATLLAAIDLVLTEQRVEGLLTVTWEKQVEQHTQYVGRGRGSQSRSQRVVEHTRYHITPYSQKTQTHHFRSVYGLTVACSSSCNPPSYRP